MPTFDSRPLWIRARPVAQSLGLTLPSLESAIASGKVPLRTLAVGKRELLYVHSGDVAKYRDSLGDHDVRNTHQR